MIPNQHLCHLASVKLQRFWCGDIPFVAYQFGTGEIAMNQAQFLPAYSTALSKIASNFIETHHLPTVKAILPNHTIATLYPLIPTVRAVWSHFQAKGKLSAQKKLLRELLTSTPILKDEDILLSKTSESKIEVASASTTLAIATTLKIQELSLPAFLYEGSLYICDQEGLSIINVSLRWLIELNPAQRKAMLLKKSGFSFREEMLFYQENRLFQLKARVWSDWIILWEYFAKKGNSKALSILRHLATQGLEKSLLDRISEHKECERFYEKKN
jgi:hypothetical protein